MFKTASINWDKMSLNDLLWIDAAIFVQKQLQIKNKQVELTQIADIVVLLKDVDDIQRLKGGLKQQNLVKWSDLPSNYDPNKKQVDQSVQIRKNFLKNLSNKFNK